MGTTLQNELTAYFRGLKRMVGDAQSVKIGKDLLSFELYSDAQSVKIGKDLLSFELYSDAQSVKIGIDPLSFELYSSVCDAAMVSTLALRIYWATFPFKVNLDQLFAGSTQYDRFRKQLGAILATEPIKCTLERMGIDAKDVGTHSIRKGAATFCSSGSTTCPSSAAVHLRTGWSLSGVQNIYLRYESAGDMHVGRTVCGLPQNSENLGLLPPRFATVDSVVAGCVRCAFGEVPEHLALVAEFALASLVYHRDYLYETLPPKRPLLLSPLFGDKSSIDELYSRVKCGLPSDSNGPAASGVPPHCVLLGKMQHVETAVQEFQGRVVGEVVDCVRSAFLAIEEAYH